METVNAVAKESSLKKWLGKYGSFLISYGGLIFCLLLFTIVTPLFGESIWSPEKIATLMSNMIVTALMSVGAVFIYAMGNLDISIGKQIGLYTTLMVVLGNATDSLLLPIVVCLALSVVIAVINGGAGPLFNIISIIPSVVVMQVLGGIITMIYADFGARSVSLRTIDYGVFKSPVLMFVVLLIETVIAGLLFNYTRIGKYAKALGENRTAAMQSGVNLLKFRILGYICAGFCFVLAAVFQMGYTGSASDSTGTGFEMNIMVALILGGMPISGGVRSRISAAIIGSLTFSLLDVGLPMIGLPIRMTFIVKAAIFLVVVLITSRQKGSALPK